MSQPDLTRGMRFNIVFLGFLLPIVVMLVVETVKRTRNRVDDPGTSAQRTCDARVLQQTCGEHEACIADVCRRLPVGEVCLEGPASENCTCALGLERHLGACVRPDQLVVANGLCSPRELELPLHLRDICLDNRGLQTGSILDCDADVWQSSSEPIFQLDLLQRTGSFLVHFDPEAVGEGVISEDPLAYTEALMPHLDRLREAKAVLIIGHPHSQEASAESLAQQRAEFVARRISAKLEGDPPKLWHWSLANTLTINTAQLAEILKQRGRRSLHNYPPVTWHQNVTERLLVALNPRQILPIHQDQSDWLSKMFHHSVLVVPLYCNGTEYDPTHWSSHYDRTDLQTQG